METAWIIFVIVINGGLAFYGAVLLLRTRRRRKLHERIISVLEELEAAKAKERGAAETENTKENTHTDVDTPPTV